MTIRLSRYLAQFPPLTPPAKKDGKCGECAGTGTLTRLGGDWGKTPDTTVPCWRCHGTGKEAAL